MGREFQKMSNKTKTYMLVTIVVLGLMIIFGFKNAGSIYFNGHNYNAGSLFQPEEYSHSGLGTKYDDKTMGNLANSIWGNPKDLNDQLVKLRRKNLPIVVICGAVTVIMGFSTWKEDEFKDFLLAIR